MVHLVKWLLAFLLITGACILLPAQAKLNVKAGVAALRFHDEKEINDEIWHAEHRYGFDVIIHSYRWLFIPGFHYQRLSINGDEDAIGGEIFDHRANFHQIRIPGSVGYEILDYSTLRWSVYAGPHVNFMVAIDDNPGDLNFEQIHELSAGLHFGTQFSVSIITLDIFLDHGLTKIIKARSDSKARGAGLSVGLKF